MEQKLKERFFILNHLGYAIYSVDLDRDKVYFLDSEVRVNSEKNTLSWTRHLGELERGFLRDDKNVARLLSVDSLRRTYEFGLRNLVMEFETCSLNVIFYAGETGELMSLVALQRMGDSSALSRVVSAYITGQCDYFAFLNSKTGRFMMFIENQESPMPPVGNVDFEAEIRHYAREFVAEEDRERFVRELSLPSLLAKLETKKVCSFQANVRDPRRPFARKYWEYGYLSGKRDLIFFSCRDITDWYLEEQRHQEELNAASREANVDGLTGLLNVRAFKEQVDRWMAGGKERAALLFIDLDFFKRINDTFGHATGNEVLREVASILQSAIRGNDLAGRIGGDEFVVYLRGIPSQKEAVNIARRICREIEGVGLGRPDGFPISASIGIALSPKDGASYEELLGTADQRLYFAKASGKNGVCVSADGRLQYEGAPFAQQNFQ